MKKMVLGFTIFLIVMLCFMSTALAEGDALEGQESPTQTEATPMPFPTPTAIPTTTPEPTPEPTPQPTPVVDQLIIDSRHLYDGMDRTYQQGYVPRVADGRVYIILPLLGETYDGKVTVTADLGSTTGSPFVFGNYSQTASGWGKYVFTLEIPLVSERIKGSYPVTLKADYLDVLGQQKQQSTQQR